MSLKNPGPQSLFQSIAQKWKNVSIGKKLYFVIGIMGILILGELITVRFAMKTLSAARALVGGESVWSKAQKDSVFSLQRYRITLDEKDYQDFLNHMKVAEGDHDARIELLKPKGDFAIIERGFLQGQFHPDDIPPVVELLRRFYWISYLADAIKIWAQGDELMGMLKEKGVQYRDALLKKQYEHAEAIFSDIKALNEQLTGLEIEFSNVLGAGSRWLESVVLFLLTLAVLTVEAVGLTLAILTNRSISRGLDALQTTANEIAKGNFNSILPVHSTDEIGNLSKSVNEMGKILKDSYGELEKRVEERTAEARAAVQMRDEFLSIASHELRTPLTALSLELQVLNRTILKTTDTEEKQKIAKLSNHSLYHVKRLTTLLDELLDLTRIQHGKFEMRMELSNLATITQDVVTRFAFEAANKGATISIHAPLPVQAFVDASRIEQVVANLVSNAIKYGNSTPISVSVTKDGPKATLIVEDQGPGMSVEVQEKIFKRFERGEDSGSNNDLRIDPKVEQISGLGLGLYITHQIIEAHGGTIRVESSPGKGARFIVQLAT